ncbi:MULTISPECIES: TetR/AcrR family transcriptional regulator [unclassified Pseudomonas]|uniref:TetR/AcrR family transcriptional regulator n=1 Tax=unclassified Pseudomonas TaxID=196821 RepID=UPI000A1FBD4C|nr:MULTISPECIES: TetR/AcrR family transcriptional regulator [unclassified Pseudomonas]
MPNAPRPAPADTPGPLLDGQPEPRARRGRPVGNHEEKRTGLLKAVMSVIAREGYADTSMRKVAQQAGCTTGAVTYYFANKEEMVTAAARHLFDEFDILLRGGSDLDIGALIKEWLNLAKTEEADAWLALFQLMAHARHEPAFVKVFEERYARFREAFSSVLTRGQRDGTIREDVEATVLADLICAMGDGWMMAKPIEPERFTDARKEALLAAVLTLIAPPPAR